MSRVAREAWDTAIYLQTDLNDLEVHLGISECWTSQSPDYQKAIKYMNQRQFQLAVDKLEGLVVQRLFELTKANASETGTNIKQSCLLFIIAVI